MRSENAPLAALNIYIEDTRDRPAEFCITAERINFAFGALGDQVHVSVHFADDPDIRSLSRASIFVGASFNKALLRQYGGALKIIHCTNAGVEPCLPLDWLPADAVLTNSRGIHAKKAGEFGLLALLMLNDIVPQHQTNQRRHVWKRKLSTPIQGKSCLIYGAGSIGNAIAANAKLLGINVIGIRRSGLPTPEIANMHPPQALHELLPRVDFLVLCCPLTSETRCLIGERELSLLRPTAGLVNIARAGVIDSAALRRALNEDTISGAILDVFEQEPLPADSSWWDTPNLTVIPHVSSDDPDQYITNSLSIVRDNAVRLLNGQALKNVVRPELGY